MADGPAAVLSETKALPFLEETGKLIGVLGVALLILSVAHDYFFLVALSLTFNEVATSISDHVRSAIVWLPKLVLFTFAMFVYEVLMRRVEGGRTEQELIETSPTPRFTKWFRFGANAAFVLSVVFIVLTTTLLTASLHLLFLGFILFWGFLSYSVVQHPHMGAGFTATGARVFIIVPLIVAYVGSFGYGSGERMLTAQTPEWDVAIKTENGTEHRKLVGMRTFGTTVVTVDNEKRVSVVPSERLQAVTRIPQHDDRSSNVRRWFGVP
ncbi:MAG TPA: hypothetical protein VIS96_14265 [Terrimicrobiaceae bacterium]